MRVSNQKQPNLLSQLMLTKYRQHSFNSSKCNSKTNFGKNKMYIYADFDRTLSPNTTADVFYAKDSHKLEKAKYNFDLINKLLQKYKDINLFITTGRTNTELKRMFELYKKQQIDFINADSVYTKEGADEYLKAKTDQNTYPYTKTNMQRNNELIKKSRWKKELHQEIIINILKRNNLTPLLCDTTLSAEKYGKYSIFSTPEKLTERSVLIREVGQMKIFLGFAESITKSEYNKLLTQIKNYFKNCGIKINIKEKEKDYECNGYRTIMISPIINNQVLSKAFDIKEKFKTIDESDIIIVAGDGKNDIEMLNPESYLTCTDQTNIKSDKNTSKNESTINPKNEIKKLPFLGIIIKKENEPEPTLDELDTKYGQKSEYKKILCINEGELADTIKVLAKAKFKHNQN